MKKYIREKVLWWFQIWQLLRSVQRVEKSLTKLHRKVDRIMAVTKQQFDELREAFNAETNALAARIEAAIASAKSNGGLTGPEGDAVFAEFTAVRDRLKTLGASAENPIPVDDNPPVPSSNI